MTSKPSIDILLAAYNGAAYLEAQLDSILHQTEPGWRLLIRDDGSSDATSSIIERYRSADPGRIAVVRDGLGNLGISGNFSALMAASDADYVMLCDQDDVWLPEKVARSLRALQALERRHGAATPLLVHSDLRVVDAELREICPSFFRAQRFEPAKQRQINRLCLQNIATGCSVMINRALAELASPIPAEAMMHDWWLALIAATRGAIDSIDEPLILYRQHAGNMAGARPFGLFDRIVGSSRVAAWREWRRHLRQSQRQAAVLLAAHGDAMAPDARRVVAGYAGASERGPLARRIDLIRHGIRFGDHLKNAVLFVLI